MIGVEVITESCFKVPYLKISKKKTYVAGEKYTLSARMTNMGKTSFSGTFQMLVEWPNGLVVQWGFAVQNLAPNHMSEQMYGPTGITDVLDSDPAIFLLKGQDAQGQPVNFYDRAGNPLSPQQSGFTHVHTIIPKNAEELYQLWALAVAVASLIPILIKDVIIPLAFWIIQLLSKIVACEG